MMWAVIWTICITFVSMVSEHFKSNLLFKNASTILYLHRAAIVWISGFASKHIGHRQPAKSHYWRSNRIFLSEGTCFGRKCCPFVSAEWPVERLSTSMQMYYLFFTYPMLLLISTNFFPVYRHRLRSIAHSRARQHCPVRTEKFVQCAGDLYVP